MTEFTNVTDRQTDRQTDGQTDGQTPHDGIERACIASGLQSILESTELHVAA